MEREQEEKKESASARYRQRVALAKCLGERSYPRYLRAVWHSTAAFSYVSTTLTVFRRLRFARIALRVLRAAWITLQTGAIVLLLVPVLLILLAVLVVLSLVMLLGVALDSRRVCRRLSEQMQGRSVVFLTGDASDSPFFRGQLRELSERTEVMTVVRSPYWLTMRGFGGRGFYLSAREELRGVYLARTPTFFMLRRLACRLSERVVFVV